MYESRVSNMEIAVCTMLASQESGLPTKARNHKQGRSSRTSECHEGKNKQQQHCKKLQESSDRQFMHAHAPNSCRRVHECMLGRDRRLKQKHTSIPDKSLSSLIGRIVPVVFYSWHSTEGKKRASRHYPRLFVDDEKEDNLARRPSDG